MPLKPMSALRKDKASARGVQLQHRHFAFIAGVINTASGIVDNDEKQRWASRFARSLETTNPAFNRERFFTACGVADPVLELAAYPGARHVLGQIEQGK